VITDNLRADLYDVVRDEPELMLTLDTVVAAGRSRRRRRRTGYGAGIAAVAAFAVAVAGVGVIGSSEGTITQEVALTPRVATVTPEAVTPAAGATSLTTEQQRIHQAIVDASPAGWTFEMSADRWQAWNGLEATANDGSGPGRLMLGATTQPGAQQVRPCRDPEFKSGVACTETRLADGSVLSERALKDWNGIKTIEVVLSHPNGTGVMAESGNFTIPWPLPEIITPEAKGHLPEISRTEPTYTTSQLAEVVKRVDAALR
jgi:hypothetical protein